MSAPIPNAAPPHQAITGDDHRFPCVNAVGANERIIVGVVGLGYSAGLNHLFGIRDAAKENNVVATAVCDVCEPRLAFARKRAGLKETDSYRDYRRMLDRKEI